MPPRPPRPIPHHHPHTRFYPRQPIVYDFPTQTFVVDSSGPELPWRIVHMNSWGTTVVFRAASMADALKFFKSMNLSPKVVGFNVTAALQRWNGAGWQTEASRNSQSELHGLNDNVSEGISTGTLIMGALAALGLYLIL